MWETLSDTSGQRQEVPQLLPHETVIYWVTAAFLHYVHRHTGRMVLAGKKDPSKTMVAPNFPSHLEIRDCAVRQGLQPKPQSRATYL